MTPFGWMLLNHDASSFALFSPLEQRGLLLATLPAKTQRAGLAQVWNDFSSQALHLLSGIEERGQLDKLRPCIHDLAQTGNAG